VGAQTAERSCPEGCFLCNAGWLAALTGWLAELFRSCFLCNAGWLAGLAGWLASCLGAAFYVMLAELFRVLAGWLAELFVFFGLHERFMHLAPRLHAESEHVWKAVHR
jgi:hypothetical protein